MDEADRPAARRRRLQHAHGRGDADAAGHQHQGPLRRGFQLEVAAGRQHLQLRADHRLRMQPVRDPAALLALDADPVERLARRVRQRVVAPHRFAVHRQHQRQVLARHEIEQRAAVDRLQVERGDQLALHLAPRHPEGALTAPAAVARCIAGIHLFLGGDQQVGQRLVGLAPGGQDLVGGGFAQHLADGAQQALADDRVVLGQHAERGVLVDDARQRAGDLVEAVDVRGIGQHGAGQRLGLGAAGLVGLVEEGLHLRVLAEHELVEVAGDGLALLLQDRHGGLDEGDGLGVEHATSHPRTVPARKSLSHKRKLELWSNRPRCPLSQIPHPLSNRPPPPTCRPATPSCSPPPAMRWPAMRPRCCGWTARC